MGVVVLLLLTGLVNNIFYSSRPKILGFATTIYTKEIVELTNSEREKEGLKTLKENPVLAKIAQEKGQDMFAKNYWAHASPEGIMPWYFFQKNDYKYLYAGENLARDFYTSSAVVSAWMNSPSHRENMLGKNYTEIGVAVLNGKFDGMETTLIVQMFGAPLNTSNSLALAKPEETIAKPKTAVSTISVAQTLPVSTMGITQKIYLGFSILLLGFFLFDSVILIKERVRERHPYFHVVILGVVVFTLIYLNKGLIL